MNTSKREKTIKELFIGKCWDYLNDNFHKFTDDNKLKVALELCKKNLPQEIEGNINTNIVMMGTIKKGNEEMEFRIGDPSRDVEPASEAPADNREV